jgi:hypothetical protein
MNGQVLGPTGQDWYGLLHFRYIVGIVVTGFPNEARYLLISVYNEL